jgi:hypothetical protein
VERAFRRCLPESADESVFQALDAKRLLRQEGEIARAVGRPLRPGQIARAMSHRELHPDIWTLFERVRASLTPP